MDRSAGFQRVTRDILDLLELQLQLLSVDSQAAKRHLTRSLICGTVAATFATSALTVLLFGGGMLIGELTNLSTGTALILVASATFGIVTVLLWISVAAITAAASAIEDSKSEFVENMRWLKATLISPDTSPRNQLRSESFPIDRADGAVVSSPRSERFSKTTSSLPTR